MDIDYVIFGLFLASVCLFVLNVVFDSRNPAARLPVERFGDDDNHGQSFSSHAAMFSDGYFFDDPTSSLAVGRRHSFNVDGTPMHGAFDIDGNPYGMTSSAFDDDNDDSFTADSSSTSLFDNDWSCDSSADDWSSNSCDDWSSHSSDDW